MLVGISPQHIARIGLAAWGLLVLPATAWAQDSPWLPSGELPGLLADPKEPRMGIRLMFVGDGSSRFGRGVEWEADFGHGIPFIRFSGDSPEHSVFLGVKAGVFGRFSFETTKRDLISSDWLFALPLFIRRGRNWVRIQYKHISAHLGDDYIQRFNVEPEGYLRDGVGIVVYRQVNDLFGLYGGGDAAFNVDPNRNKRLALQGGIELNGGAARRSSRVYGGADVFLDQDVSWQPRVNIHSGLRLMPHGDKGLRVTMEIVLGSSPQASFRDNNVALAILGLEVDI